LELVSALQRQDFLPSSSIELRVSVPVTALLRDFVSHLIKSTNFLIFIFMQLRAEMNYWFSVGFGCG